MTANFPKNLSVRRPESSRPFPALSVRSGQGQAHSATVVSPFSVPHPRPLSRSPLWVPLPLPGGTQPELGWRNDRKCRKVQIRSEAPAAPLEMGKRFRKMWGEKPIPGGKQRFGGERTAGWPGRKPASLRPRVTDKPLARALLRPGGLRSDRGLLLPPPQSPPLPHQRPQPGKPRVHLLIWTWLSNPKPGTQGLTMNWILDGGEWRGGYTLHSDTSPGCTPRDPLA